MDMEKIIRIIDELIFEAQKEPTWKAENALRCLKKELLKEQEEKQTPKPIIHGDKEEYWGEEEICPVCGKRWQSADIDSTHFCPGCGQSVIWENT